MTNWLLLILSILALILVVVSCVTPIGAGPTPLPSSTPYPTRPLSDTYDIIDQIYDEVERGVRAEGLITPTPVHASSSVNNPLKVPIGAQLMDLVERVRPAVVQVSHSYGSGTGVIFETNGRDAYILTNQHVIDRAGHISVKVNDRTNYTATLLGLDSQRDLAVLSICCGQFVALPFGDVSEIAAGQDIVTIGYPVGSQLEGPATITTGIISAVRFDRSEQAWMIQTDAAINPGNSGGPMLSLAGEVLGINTAKIEESGGRPVERIGFAISIQTIEPRLDGLKGGSPVPQSTAMPTRAPTATPAPTKVPTPTPTRIPTRIPATTPSGPTPTSPSTSVCHYYDVDVLNEEWAEREALYRGALAASGSYRALNELGRTILEERFPAINARYVLENLMSPYTGTRRTTFRAWLGSTTFDGDYPFVDKLLSIQKQAGAFLPQIGQDFEDWSDGHPRQKCNPYYELLEDTVLTQELIVVVAGSTINPALRQSYVSNVIDSTFAWMYNYPSTPLFAEFAKRGFQW